MSDDPARGWVRSAVTLSALGLSAAFWTLAGAYALGAGLFTYLLYFGAGLAARLPRG